MIQKKLKVKIPFYDGITKNNWLDLYICSSWFQKSTRRFKVDNAINYTRELIESWNIDYIWRRIFIIVCEDIGLWNLYLWELILNLYKKFKETENYKEFDDKYIYQSVLILLYSNKSRENDNFYHSILNHWLVDENWKKFIKKYCIEKYYNSKSKKIQREVLDLLDIEFKDFISEKLFSIYKECLITCWDLWWKDWINLYFINFYLIKKYSLWNNYYKDSNKNLWLSDVIKNIPKSLNLWKLKKLVPDNYCYDKHTSYGKKLNRGDLHFFKEWCKLINEVNVWDNIYTDYIKKKFNLD